MEKSYFKAKIKFKNINVAGIIMDQIKIDLEK